MTMVLVAVAMIAIAAMAALSIDLVTLYLARMEAQRAADAGALAAARVISLSGLTGDPGNSSGYWTQICGDSGSVATHAALAAATQGSVDGVVPTVTVKYSAGGFAPQPNCVGLPPAFGVNPLVTVQVSRNNLPTFFSRIWGNTGNTINATAVAEAFNSSNSANEGNGPTGTITPVQPRCVKPWMVPNQDPLHPGINGDGVYCNDLDPRTGRTTPCDSLVGVSNGSITSQGISLNGGGSNGVIGETFWLSPVCTHTGSGCTIRPGIPPVAANYSGSSPYIKPAPSLLYLPGLAPTVTPVAVPSCSTGQSLYQQTVAGCDQSTVYQCGVQNMNTVELTENPDIDTSEGVLCLTHEASASTLDDGQDSIDDSGPAPFPILAGRSNPLAGAGLPTGNQISTSNSIVSFPIYDSVGVTTFGGGATTVTIVGFMQVFINQVDQYGSISVTVLNVTGCSNGTGQTVGTAVAGSSPVPVRLITSP